MSADQSVIPDGMSMVVFVLQPLNSGFTSRSGAKPGFRSGSTQSDDARNDTVGDQSREWPIVG